jgi:hypothetical protein
MATSFFSFLPSLRLNNAAVLFALSLCAFGYFPVFADIIDDCPVGNWCEMPNTSLQASGKLATGIPGSAGVQAVMSAWNSGVFDARRNRLIIFGGGHNDYAGNEIYAFDFSSLTWERIWGPSANIPTGGPCSPAYPDGNPASRHTYDGLAYSHARDSMIVVGGSVWQCGFGSVDVWEFNFATLTWSRKADSPYTSLQIATAYDGNSHNPSTGWVWAISQNSGDNLGAYNPATDAWTTRSDLGGTGSHNSLTIDTKRWRAYLLIAGALHRYDLSTSGNATRAIESSDPPPGGLGGHAGFEYDPVRDRLIAWQSTGCTVYVYNPNAAAGSRWSSEGSGSTCPVAQSNGTWGRFSYNPIRNVMVYVGSINTNVFIYKGSNSEGR